MGSSQLLSLSLDFIAEPVLDHQKSQSNSVGVSIKRVDEFSVKNSLLIAPYFFIKFWRCRCEEGTKDCSAFTLL